LSKIYLLSPTKFEGTIHNPTIQIEFLDKNLIFSETDILIFTSKNGVEAVNQISENWKKFPAIAVGKRTESFILKLGGKVLATSSGNGESLEKLILENFHENKFIYFRPQEVAREIGKNLRKKNISVKEEIVYKTVCKKQKEIEKGSIVIATSPLSVKCLFQNSKVPKETIFIAIGQTTKKAIPKEFKILVADEPSLNSCYKKAVAIQTSEF
jgi:uroporphyrinogen-III synthase